MRSKSKRSAKAVHNRSNKPPKQSKQLSTAIHDDYIDDYEARMEAEAELEAEAEAEEDEDSMGDA